MSFLSTIEYVHSVKYYAKGIASDGPYYRVEYFIDDWAKSDAFVNKLLGLGMPGGPHRHPLCPNVICTEAHAEGRGKPILAPTGLPDYSGGARIAAVYKNPAAAYGGSGTDLSIDDPYGKHQIDPTNPIPWCTQELDYATEVIALNNTYFLWESDSKKSTVQFVQDVHITTLHLNFQRRSELPVGKVRRHRGRINASEFLGADPECVRFLGAKTRREDSPDGLLSQSVALVFQERDVSWNKFLRPDTGAWDYLKSPTTGRRRYPTSDFNDLLQLL
ncbi:MAG: hypothetical protein U0790_00210 [Isosphaeraceae bacterium]